MPEMGYRGNVNQSLIALCWLHEINETCEPIEYRLSREGERKILGRFLDSYCEESNTLYQFHWCFYHGCVNCFDMNDYNRMLKESFKNLAEKTRMFTNLLKLKGYKVVEKWEWEYLRKKKTQKLTCTKVKSFFLNLFLSIRKMPCSPECLKYSAKENEKIMYLDFTSYPSVQKKNIFPVGHPQIYIRKDECRKIDLKNVMVLVKCTVLPPRNLLFPVLPVRIEGKLIFPLWFACAKEKQQACNHVETERYLCGTWTSVEINKAVEKKYQIVEIFEIYDYKQGKQIFGEYVNTFLKFKHESSGVTKDCLNKDGRVNEQRLDNFVKDFQRVEGVLLEKEKIQKNPALRTIAKKLLNSLWGK